MTNTSGATFMITIRYPEPQVSDLDYVRIVRFTDRPTCVIPVAALVVPCHPT